MYSKYGIAFINNTEMIKLFQDILDVRNAQQWFDDNHSLLSAIVGKTDNYSSVNWNTICSGISSASQIIELFVNIDEMESIIEEKGITLNACEKMIFTARKNGSKDDASVIIGGVR